MSLTPPQLPRTQKYQDLTVYEEEQKIKNLTSIIVKKIFQSLQIKYPNRNIKIGEIKHIKTIKGLIDPIEFPQAQPYSFSEIMVPGYIFNYKYKNEQFKVEVEPTESFIRLNDIFDPIGITKKTLKKLASLFLKFSKLKPAEPIVTEAMLLQVWDKGLKYPGTIVTNSHLIFAYRIEMKMCSTSFKVIVTQNESRARHDPSSKSENLLNNGKVFDL